MDNINGGRNTPIQSLSHRRSSVCLCAWVCICVVPLSGLFNKHRVPTGKHWQNNIIPLSLSLSLSLCVCPLLPLTLFSNKSNIFLSLSSFLFVNSLSRGLVFSCLPLSILPSPTHSLSLVIRPIFRYTPLGPNLTPKPETAVVSAQFTQKSHPWKMLKRLMNAVPPEY